jgi:hypothetical protein
VNFTKLACNQGKKFDVHNFQASEQKLKIEILGGHKVSGSKRVSRKHSMEGDESTMKAAPPTGDKEPEVDEPDFVGGRVAGRLERHLAIMTAKEKKEFWKAVNLKNKMNPSAVAVARGAIKASAKKVQKNFLMWSGLVERLVLEKP